MEPTVEDDVADAEPILPVNEESSSSSESDGDDQPEEVVKLQTISIQEIKDSYAQGISVEVESEDETDITPGEVVWDMEQVDTLGVGQGVVATLTGTPEQHVYNQVSEYSGTEYETLDDEFQEDAGMEDMGIAQRILGMDICGDSSDGMLFSSQSRYLLKVLTRFNMKDCGSVETSMVPRVQCSDEQCSKIWRKLSYMSRVSYGSANGRISYVDDMLSDTKMMGLKFKTSNDLQNPLVGHVDADFAGNKNGRKSITGYVFTLFGTTVSWKASQQSVVALSTTEAEYMAITEGVKEAIWLGGLLRELGVQLDHVNIHSDN